MQIHKNVPQFEWEKRNPRARAYLMAPLHSWEVLYGSESGKRRKDALIDLCTFKARLREWYLQLGVPHGNSLVFGGPGQLSYMRRLQRLDESLRRKNWDIACHELTDPVYWSYFQDKRVLGTILNMLERFCDEVD